MISILKYGALFEVSGGEPQMVYSIWRQVHHLAVYQWPLAYPFSLSLYNYLFYYTYAAAMKLIGAWGEEIMIWSRMFTLTFAVLGAIAQWRLVRSYLHLRGRLSALSLVLSVGLWSCASIVRYNALTVRPDVPAVALVMCALCVIVTRPRFCFAYAGVLFYLAWSFKQSIVLALLGVCLFLLFHKRWRDLSMVVMVYAVLIGITLLLGTPEYRFSILAAPRLMNVFSFWHSLPPAMRAVAANAYWILPPFVLLFATNARRTDHTVRLLFVALLVTLVGGIAAMGRIGAWDYYLLEAFAAGSTLLQLAVFMVPGRFVTALLVFGCLQPTVQLVMHPAGRVAHTFGTVGLATASEFKDADLLRQRLLQLKKPIFSSEEMFALPWISNDGRAPAMMIDHIFYKAMRNRYVNGGVEGMLQRGEIPTVMLGSTETHYLDSLNSSYKKIGEVTYSNGLFYIYILDQKVNSLGVR
jgi:hypothetical protein